MQLVQMHIVQQLKQATLDNNQPGQPLSRGGLGFRKYTATPKQYQQHQHITRVTTYRRCKIYFSFGTEASFAFIFRFRTQQLVSQDSHYRNH